ncbi:hypothetical protein [Pseudomonas asiatica]|uniref:hypothetical protein n=1 Tax=Pseudomonas asiatica TaxID=2219225 RepID=UPI0010C03AE5|nr:hypothetical protein [Pseudomonas asiatica]
MNRKEPFNDAAQGKEEARKQQIAEWERERDHQLQACKEEQRRRDEEDMEKARPQVLREHNRLNLRPDYARRKALTSEQLEERARLVVEAQNLRELNAINNAHNERVIAFKASFRQAEHSAPGHERTRSPHEIKGIFNGLPKAREGREPERER